MSKLVDVSHVSRRGTSFRITVPRNVAEKIGAQEQDIVGFYEEGGRVLLKKME